MTHQMTGRPLGDSKRHVQTIEETERRCVNNGDTECHIRNVDLQRAAHRLHKNTSIKGGDIRWIGTMAQLTASF